MGDNLGNLIIPKFLDEALTPVAREIGQGFGDLFYYIFLPFHKLRLRKEWELQQFALELKSNIESIPEEKLVEPPLHIVGPALEASKYYYEEKELRDMYAKLISSSMNADTQNQVRTSFIEIIKQMEPLDAVVFKELYRQFYSFDLDRRYVMKLGLNSEFYEDVFPLDCLNNQNIGDVVTSVSNLKRLGLIQVDYPTDVELQTQYSIFFHEQEVKKWLQGILGRKEILIIYGSWNITPFGEQFALCCLPDIEIEQKLEL